MPVPDGNDGCAANSYPESANIDILKKKKRKEIEEVEKRRRTAQNSKNCLARIRKFDCKINIIRFERKLS